MSWVRHGDESDTNPRLMSLVSLGDFDDRTVNEVHGFVSRCAAYSARHETDYIVDLGVIFMFGGSHTDRLLRLCLGVGLLEQVEVKGIRKYKIVEDIDYIHIQLKGEKAWANQRKRDNADPNLKGPVLLRDGDRCRWCGKEVIWPGKASARKATLDHLKPGQPGTVDTLVVACLSCNSARQEDDTGSWDTYHKLLPVPTHPLYGAWTRKYLSERGLTPPPADSHRASDQSESDSTSPSPTRGDGPGVDGTGRVVAGSPVREGAATEVDPSEADHLRADGPSTGGISSEVDPSEADHLRAAGPSDEPSAGSVNRDSCEIPPQNIRLGSDWPPTGPSTGPVEGYGLASPRVGKGRDGPRRERKGWAGPGAAPLPAPRAGKKRKRRRR